MAATLCLLGWMLIPGQSMMQSPRPSARQPAAAFSGEWLLVPRLRRAQELVYRGTFTEEGRGSRVQFGRTYRLESHIFVLDTPPRGADLAVLTLLKHRAPVGELTTDSTPVSVRLERASVDLQGRVNGEADVDLLPPLDAAPTLECGVFVALPGGHIAPGQEWMTTEGDRPPLNWRAAGTEMAGGNSCLKLVAEQKAEEWDHPRGDRSAWRRVETVWLVPHLGLAYRVEREIQQREPGCREATQRSLLRIEMDSPFQLSGQAADSRRQEILQAFSLRNSLKPYLTEPTHYGPQLAAMVRRIDEFLENQPESPYRPAIVQVKRRVEAAQRGESPPEPIRETRPILTGAAIGQRAPDFLVSNFSSGGSAQLRRWMGKPVVLVFYHPSSQTAALVLRYAQQLQAAYPQRITVAGMSVCDDSELVRRQQNELHLTIPLLSAGGLRASFGVQSTPKIVLLDGSNVIRGEYQGWAWGGETARELQEELKRWLPLGVPVPPAPQPR